MHHSAHHNTGASLGYLLGEITGQAQGQLQTQPIGFDMKRSPTGFVQQLHQPEELPLLRAPAEGHQMVIAGTGAGKGRSKAIPMLLECDNPMIVLDVKGELYATTARRRREMGHDVYCLDFCGITNGPTHSFNPLDSFRNTKPDELEMQAQLMSNMLSFEKSGLSDAFWDAWGINLIAATIAAMIATKPQDEWTLRQYFKQIFSNDLIYSLAVVLDTVGPKLPAMAYQEIGSFLQLTEITRSGVSATAQSYLKALMSEPVLKATDQSDFTLEDVRDGKPMTIYIVFPPEYISSHSSLLRLWVGALLQAITSRKEIPAKRTIFLLDEAAQLGSFSYLETVLTLCRGYGVSCVTFWQDLQQVKERYPGWQTLLNNCSVLQFFGCKNYLVAKGVEEITGITAPRIASLPDDEQVVVINGKNLLSKRFDYLSDPRFAGMFDANPFYGRGSGPDLNRGGAAS